MVFHLSSSVHRDKKSIVKDDRRSLTSTKRRCGLRRGGSALGLVFGKMPSVQQSDMTAQERSSMPSTLHSISFGMVICLLSLLAVGVQGHNTHSGSDQWSANRRQR